MLTCYDLPSKVKDFCHLGRIKDVVSVLKDSTFQSKQMGKRENKVLNIEGRVQFDLLQVCLVFVSFVTNFPSAC